MTIIISSATGDALAADQVFGRNIFATTRHRLPANAQPIQAALQAASSLEQSTDRMTHSDHLHTSRPALPRKCDYFRMEDT